MKRFRVVVMAVCALLLAACGGPTAAPPAPTLEPTLTPTQVLIVKDTPVPPTPVPTDTAVPPATRPPTLTPTLTPRPTATQTPTPATQTSVVFTDTFGAPCGLPATDDASRTYACEGGEYTMLTKAANKTFWVSYRDSRGDGVFEADMRMVAGNEATEQGVAFRISADSSGAYIFTLNPKGEYMLYLYKQPDWIELIPYTASPAIKKGTEKNHVKVVAQGERFALYANDQFLDTLSDTTWSSGRVGFLVASRDANSKFAFSNLTISKINWPLTLPAGKDRPPTPTPMPTLPADMGGLVVVNWLGSELNYTIGGKLYKIPPNSQVIIVLPPGRQTYSLDAPGLKANCGTAEGCTVDIQAGSYLTQPWKMQQ